MSRGSKDDFRISGPLYCAKCGFAMGLIIIQDKRTWFQPRMSGALMRNGEITCARCGETREFNSIPVRRAK